jgi:hypothetical protein
VTAIDAGGDTALKAPVPPIAEMPVTVFLPAAARALPADTAAVYARLDGETNPPEEVTSDRLAVSLSPDPARRLAAGRRP